MAALEEAPGHVNTLTHEEKQKLQQAWLQLGKISGIQPKDPELAKKADETVTNTIDNNDKYGQSKEFTQFLKETEPEDIRQTIWSMAKMDHPDALILRFLRARKWDVDKAIVMLVSTVKWRKEINLEDDVVFIGDSIGLKDDKTADEEKFLDQWRSAKSFVRGTDRGGRPVYVIRPRLHKTNAQPAKVMERYVLHSVESVRVMVKDPYDTACLIFDLTGFGMSNMDYTTLKFIIKIFEANYPESLGVVAVHNAPWIFQGLWKMIKGWLDPVVAAKIRFTNNTAGLEELISPENIPKEYGGLDDWEYKYIEPVAGENDKMKDVEGRAKVQAERNEIVARFEANTEAWVPLDPASPEAVELEKQRKGLTEELRANYWKLDPYLRARTLFDRLGMVMPDGSINMKP